MNFGTDAKIGTASVFVVQLQKTIGSSLAHYFDQGYRFRSKSVDLRLDYETN